MTRFTARNTPAPSLAASRRLLGPGSHLGPFDMSTSPATGGGRLGRESGRACLQPFQPGQDRPLVGRGGREQYLGAPQLEQQPG